MTKRILFIMLLFQLCLVLEAKMFFSTEGINILSITEINNNNNESRENSISADITGHTLTINFNEDVGIAQIVIRNSIEGLRTTDYGLLTKTKTKTKTKAKVFSNSFGLSQQPSSSPTAFVFVNSHGQQSTDYKLYTINSKNINYPTAL